MPVRSTGSPRSAIAPALLLLVGVGGAVFGFARSRLPVSSGADAPATMSGRGMAARDSTAASAHAATGVAESADGAAKIVERRVHALRGEMARQPGRRDLVVEMARLLRDGHRLREAVPYYRKAMEMDRLDPQGYYDLASAHAGLGEWSLAADALRDRLDQDSSDAIALYDLGAVRANQQRFAEARALLERARTATSDGEMLSRISQALARLRGS